MARNFEKIALGAILVIFLATNAFFIFGDEGKFPFVEKNVISEGPINERQAKDIALSYVKGVIKEVEDKDLYYEIDVEKDGMETEFKINKENGDVFAIEQERVEDEEELTAEQVNLIKGVLTQEQAKQIAIDALGGGVVKKVESEREGGFLIHDVVVNYNGEDWEVEVNAENGNIMEVERDD
jgi:uncharacterized membrane protein YkoI